LVRDVFSTGAWHPPAHARKSGNWAGGEEVHVPAPPTKKDTVAPNFAGFAQEFNVPPAFMATG
jgi:hypothetical protein